MLLNRLENLSQSSTDWPPLDRTLLGDSRSTPPPFPLHLLPGRWRTWAEASSLLFGSADYLAHCLLGGVAAIGGAGLRIEVASHWREPLLLWQALVGGPSSGKSASFARVAALLAEVQPHEESGDWAAPAVLVDDGLGRVAGALAGSSRGVLLWREDLGDWMEEAGGRGARRPGSRLGWRPGPRPRSAHAARPAWLAGWSAGAAIVDGLPRACVAVGIAGALSPERLASGFADGDSALASRFLYVWPERGAVPSLADSTADDAGLVALLQKIAALAGHREHPCIVPFDAAAARRLEALMPEIQRRADAADPGSGSVLAEWIGRGVPTIVRLAGVLSLMEWAETSEQTGAEWQPVGAAHVEAAHALWADYYLPHAQRLFEQAGIGPGERAARRVVRWLRRVRASRIGREDVRREALAQSVDAEEAEEVLARLETGGVVRPLAATGAAKGGPKRRRWEVHPELCGQPSSTAGGGSAVSASALTIAAQRKTESPRQETVSSRA